MSEYEKIFRNAGKELEDLSDAEMDRALEDLGNKGDVDKGSKGAPVDLRRQPINSGQQKMVEEASRAFDKGLSQGPVLSPDVEIDRFLEKAFEQSADPQIGKGEELTEGIGVKKTSSVQDKGTKKMGLGEIEDDSVG